MKGTQITFGAVAQQLAIQGWRPFPGFQASKTPAMRGWPGLNHSEWDDADLAAAIGDYQPSDDFCCCLAVQQEVVAIDLDIIDKVHAAVADKLTDNILGRTPLLRIGLRAKTNSHLPQSGRCMITQTSPPRDLLGDWAIYCVWLAPEGRTSIQLAAMFTTQHSRRQRNDSAGDAGAARSLLQ